LASLRTCDFFAANISAAQRPAGTTDESIAKRADFPAALQCARKTKP
jgi:hypothetical protein